LSYNPWIGKTNSNQQKELGIYILFLIFNGTK
jgi:hypothetical protein